MNSKYRKANGSRTTEYRDSLIHQTRLWMEGIAWHNTFSNECTPDFSCCRPEMLSPEENRREWGQRILMKLAGGVQWLSETKREAVATLRLTTEEKDRFREAARRSGHLELASWLRGLAMIEADRVLGKEATN